MNSLSQQDSLSMHFTKYNKEVEIIERVLATTTPKWPNSSTDSNLVLHVLSLGELSLR